MMVDSFEHGNWCHYSQKTYVFLKLVGKYVRLKGKKRKLMYYYLIITVIIEYAKICLNVPK